MTQTDEDEADEVDERRSQARKSEPNCARRRENVKKD